MPVVQTQTPIWSIWAAAMDNAFQLQAFVLSTGNKCAPSAGAGLTINIASGTVVVNGNTTTTAISAGSVTPTSPVNNPRRDIVFISSAGSITLTQGTEAPAPVPPALPGGACLIAVLFIPTGAADYSAGFPNAGIEDMRFIFAYDVSTGVPSSHSLGTGAAQAAAGNHTTPAATATTAGHLPVPPNNTTTFLRGDVTFATPPSATATVAGYVPTPPNDTAKFLRGDATWAAPATSTVNIKGITYNAVDTSEGTTSATFVDLATLGPTATFTTVSGDKLDCVASGNCSINVSGGNSNQLVAPKLNSAATAAADGAALGGPTTLLLSQWTVTKQFAGTVAADTVKLQYASDGTNTAAFVRRHMFLTWEK